MKNLTNTIHLTIYILHIKTEKKEKEKSRDTGLKQRTCIANEDVRS